MAEPTAEEVMDRIRPGAGVRPPAPPRVTEPRLRTPLERDPGKRRRTATKISEIPPKQRACRSGRHDWPSDRMETGKSLPRGLSAHTTGTRGVSRIEDQCGRCRKIRWKLTLPGNIYDPGAAWSYIDPPDWVRLDADLDITRGDLKAFAFAEHAAELFR